MIRNFTILCIVAYSKLTITPMICADEDHQEHLQCTRTILKAFWWLSVRQLMAYHSLVLLQKTLVHKSPKYMYDKVTAGGQSKNKTRQFSECSKKFSFNVQHPVENKSIRQETSNKWVFSRQVQCWKSVELYNTLHTSIRLNRNYQDKPQEVGAEQHQHVDYLFISHNIILQLQQKLMITFY